MADRRPELELARDIRQTREELLIVDALVRALDDPHGALDAVLSAEDTETARAALRARFGFDDFQARAVVDNLYRVATVTHRRRFEERRQELHQRLHELESRANAP